MYLIILVFFQLFVNCDIQIEQDKPVVIYVHGINDRCPIPSFEKFLQNFDFECIYLDRGDFGTLRSQANKGCLMLEPHDTKLKKGFTLVGFSQGALLARIMIQTCKYGQYVKRFISIAGPQNGVAYTPETDKNFFVNWIAFMMCDKFLFRLFVVPCNYLKFIGHYRAYEQSKFQMIEFNNEHKVNEQYRNSIENLEFFINLSFLQDQIVQPYNSGNFGYYGETDKEYIDFKDTVQYTENRLGLRTLNDKGRFLRCEVEGAHVQVSDEQYTELVVPFLDYRKKDYEQHWEYINKHCVYNQFELQKNLNFCCIFLFQKIQKKILQQKHQQQLQMHSCINQIKFFKYYTNLINLVPPFFVCFIHKKLNQSVNDLFEQEELFSFYFNAFKPSLLLVLPLFHHNFSSFTLQIFQSKFKCKIFKNNLKNRFTMALNLDQIVKNSQKNLKTIKIGVYGSFQLFKNFIQNFNQNPNNGDIVNIKNVRYTHQSQTCIIQFIFQDQNSLLEQFRQEINKNMDCLLIFAKSWTKLEKLQQFFDYGDLVTRIVAYKFDKNQLIGKKTNCNYIHIKDNDEKEANCLLQKICEINQKTLHIDVSFSKLIVLTSSSNFYCLSPLKILDLFIFLMNIYRSFLISLLSTCSSFIPNSVRLSDIKGLYNDQCKNQTKNSFYDAFGC